jgi:hypothetical protein
MSSVPADLRFRVRLDDVFRLFYRLLVGLTRLAAWTGRAKELEIIVLRHQLAVLQRNTKPLKLNDHDLLPRRDRTGTPDCPTARLADHARHAAALAPPTHRPTLDPTTVSTARTTINHQRNPQTRRADGCRESDVGLRCFGDRERRPVCLGPLIVRFDVHQRFRSRSAIRFRFGLCAVRTSASSVTKIDSSPA